MERKQKTALQENDITTLKLTCFSNNMSKPTWILLLFMSQIMRLRRWSGITILIHQLIAIINQWANYFHHDGKVITWNRSALILICIIIIWRTHALIQTNTHVTWKPKPIDGYFVLDSKNERIWRSSKKWSRFQLQKKKKTASMQNTQCSKYLSPYYKNLSLD